MDIKEEYKDIVKNDKERFNCSILLGEVRERIRKLRAYGIDDAVIEAIMHEDSILPKLLITEDYKVILTGDKSIEVQLEPLVKSLYLLFLHHPEGIIFKDLPDYRQELAEIYNKVRPWGLTDRALRSIEDVTNPMLNSINEKCARIKKVFVAMLDSSIADQYYIKGTRGDAKKIALPRDLVVWE